MHRSLQSARQQDLTERHILEDWMKLMELQRVFGSFHSADFVIQSMHRDEDRTFMMYDVQFQIVLNSTKRSNFSVGTLDGLAVTPVRRSQPFRDFETGRDLATIHLTSRLRHALFTAKTQKKILPRSDR